MAEDYDRVIAVIDDWWGGRVMHPMLPRCLFDHFRDTTFIAQHQRSLTGFLCGFRSQTYPDQAYVHFIGVAPDERGRGLGRRLYEAFFAAVAPRTVIRAITAPVNTASIEFHQRLGFMIEKVAEEYDGHGASRVLFVKYLERS